MLPSPARLLVVEDEHNAPSPTGMPRVGDLMPRM
jgi:hypothetical protein